MKKLLLVVLVACLAGLFSSANSQPRIAFLPFQNMDGNMELNLWCFVLQDSLQEEFRKRDSEGKLYHIVPADSVDELLAEMNLDPTNPQYPTDMWNAVETLKVEMVVSGNFILRANRMLLSAYVYDVRTKLANPNHQARDIFVAPERILTTIPVITNRLIPVFK